MVPQGTNSMYISWQAIGVICTVLVLVISLATTFLRLTIRSAISDMTSTLETKIKSEFSSKESVEGQLKLLNLRMEHIEIQLKDLKEQVQDK